MRVCFALIAPAQPACGRVLPPPRPTVLRTSGWPRRRAHARGIPNRVATGRGARARPRASGGGPDSARLRGRHCGQRRTRPAAVPRRDPRRRFSFRRNRRRCADRVPARETTNDHGRARSGGQVGTALGATAPDDCPSPARAHPDPESVLLVPFPVVGLERPLHAWPPRARPSAGPKWRPGAIARASGMGRKSWFSRAGGRASVRRSAGRSNPAPRARSS